MNTSKICCSLMCVILATAACGRKDEPEPECDAEHESSSGMMTSASPTTGGGPGPMTSTNPDSDGTQGTITGGFVMPSDGPLPVECGIFAQDCPRGQKCMPWANDGVDVWNATRCSPIVDDPGQPGDECSVEGSPFSGIDDCDLGSMCYDVDPETNIGACVALCSGDEENPVCEDPDASCARFDPLVLCLQNCDPIQQDCPDSSVCHPANTEAWVCSREAPGELGSYGDTCPYFNHCDPGFVCVSADEFPIGDCSDSNECCTRICDLASQDRDAQCDGQGQTCEPWYGRSAPPPGYEYVGYCGILP